MIFQIDCLTKKAAKIVQCIIFFINMPNCSYLVAYFDMLTFSVKQAFAKF